MTTSFSPLAANTDGLGGRTFTLTLQATSSSGAATGPNLGWLTINRSTGLVSGTPPTSAMSSQPYVANVTVSDSLGVLARGSYQIVVPNEIPVTNASFESGSAPWTFSYSSGLNRNSLTPFVPAHTGTHDALLGARAGSNSQSATRSITIDSSRVGAYLAFWMHVDTTQTAAQAIDVLRVTVAGQTVATYSNMNAASGWQRVAIDVSHWRGQVVTVTFQAAEQSTSSDNGQLWTRFFIDDVSRAYL